MNLQNLFPGGPANQVSHPLMVFVQEKAAWQYKYVAIDLWRDTMADEKLLDDLGADGWELAGMFPYEGSLHFYFKRLKDW